MEKKKEKGAFMLGALTTLVSLLAPGIYLLGYFYEYGFLSGFGVSTEYFPRSTEYYFVSAFNCFLDFTIRVFKNTTNVYLTICGVALVVVLISIVIVFFEKRRHKTDEIVDKIKQWRYFDYVSYPLRTGFIGFAVPYLLFFICGLVLLVPLSAYIAGEQSAKKAISEYKNCKLDEMSNTEKCTLIYDGKNKLKIKGLLVAKNDKYAAIYNGDETVIFPTDGYIINIVSGRMKLPAKPAGK
jgi:hypothetical protein